MTFRIDRSIVLDHEAEALDNACDSAARRRTRNVATGACLNENGAGKHGPATHGRLCLACREVHRGHTLESQLGADRYREVLGRARQQHVSVLAHAREMGALVELARKAA